MCNAGAAIVTSYNESVITVVPHGLHLILSDCSKRVVDVTLAPDANVEPCSEVCHESSTLFNTARVWKIRRLVTAIRKK